jgi:hypothetical protein
MEIKPHYVDFNTAKLLKEKGFDVPTLAYRQKSARIGDETILPLTLPDDEFKWKPFDWNNYSKEVPYYSIPEQHQVVEWLRIKHGIWLEARGWTNQQVGDEIWKECYQPVINGDSTDVSIFKTPQEAYSYAFDYILKKMI